MVVHARTTMRFWTDATPLTRLGYIAFLVVGLTAVHGAVLLYSLYRSEAFWPAPVRPPR
jgi:hypothetical protein